MIVLAANKRCVWFCPPLVGGTVSICVRGRNHRGIYVFFLVRERKGAYSMILSLVFYSTVLVSWNINNASVCVCRIPGINP